MRTVAVILGIMLNFILYGVGAGLAGWYPLQTMAALLVLNFFTVLFHELGHAWAFRHVGGTVQKIVVLFAAYDVRKRKFKWSRLPAGGDVGGYVAGTFRPAGQTIRDELIVSGAGPLANLVIGMLALLAVTIIGPAEPPWMAKKIAKDDIRIVATPEAGLPVGPPIMLPSDAEVSATLARHDSAMRAYELHRDGYAVMVLFVVLSIGLALLNLIPYDGSDGQRFFWALKMRRRMNGR
jgi:hypothetical protein